MDLSSGILTLGSISSWKHEAVLSGDHFLFLKKNKKNSKLRKLSHISETLWNWEKGWGDIQQYTFLVKEHCKRFVSVCIHHIGDARYA